METFSGSISLYLVIWGRHDRKGGGVLWCLKALSSIFQLYRDGMLVVFLTNCVINAYNH